MFLSSYKKAFFQNYFNLLFSDFSPNLPDFFFLFPSREHIEQKKNNQIHMSFPSSVMIESAYKNYNFCSFSRIFQFSGQLSQFFSFELLRTLKKNSQIVPAVLIEKSTKLFPNFPIFRSNFPIFFL
jgi:hypothetical protein